MVSRAFFETARIAFSRSATLADFHTTKCTDQPAFPAWQNRTLVTMARSARWCLAGSGGNGACAMPAASEKSTGHRRTLGLRPRARAAGSNCSPRQLRSAANRSSLTMDGQRSGSETMGSQVSAVITPRWSAPETSRLWPVSRASLLTLVGARSAYVVLCEQPSNLALNRTPKRRRCACRLGAG